MERKIQREYRIKNIERIYRIELNHKVVEKMTIVCSK